MSPKRCCWECKHIWFVAACPGYSEMTPGTDFHLQCNKTVQRGGNTNYRWEFEQYDDTLEDFRCKLESAETCPDFEARLGQEGEVAGD